MRIGGGRHLTYCTNIHPGNGWDAVLANLRIYGPQLKARLSPDAPFGLGLRLSAAEAGQLLGGGHMAEFQKFLNSEGLYVALINGYPYGEFHGAPVKAEVFAPDWRQDSRLRYTLDMADILSRLAPEDVDAGISTVPLSYKPWGVDEAGWSAIVRNLVLMCEALVRLENKTGYNIHLDIEPEPDGLIETTAETVAFFEQRLIPGGAPLLADALGVDAGRAERMLRDHIAVCFDTCHFAVEFEECGEALEALEKAGIRIGRVQISAAVRAGAGAKELSALDEPVYLHQVIERRGDGSLHRRRDLPEALAGGAGPAAREWRVHFHVPLFTSQFGELDSTHDGILPVLASLPRTSHLEIETYTWSVLPDSLRVGLADSIEREYRWVLDSLCTKQSS